MLLCLTQAAATSAQMSNEEQIVRQTYANLAYAVKLHTVFSVGLQRKALESDIENKTSQTLKFQINNLTSGPISEILDKKYSDLVTKPDYNQDGIVVSPVNANYKEPSAADAAQSEETKGLYARAMWGHGFTSQENWDTPVREVLAIMPNGSQFTRYAAYTITASMDGRSRTYKAMFLLGSNNLVQAADTVTGVGQLTRFKQGVDAKILMRPYMIRQHPAVADWLKAHKRSDGPCDLQAMDCGPQDTDVQNALTEAAKPEPRLKPIRYITTMKDGKPRLVRTAMGPGCDTDGDCLPPTPCEAGLDDWVVNPPHVGTGTSTEQHITGAHTYSYKTDMACSYNAPQYDGGACSTSATAMHTIAVMVENCDSICIYTQGAHVDGEIDSFGASIGVYGPTDATTDAAFEVINCWFGACTPTLTLDPLIWDPGTIFTFLHSDTIACAANYDGSPIIVDVDGNGYWLTSARDGVTFDLDGNGHSLQWAWTAAGSTNAFLALDRNGNGQIDNGKELFGNAADQPDGGDRNGYRALAEFDKPQNGGNGDGIIDAHDAVWSKLLLWIDSNHNGISEPGELHHLAEFGIQSISLQYKEVKRVDQYGNWYHYKGQINPNQANAKQVIWDVFFSVLKPTSPATLTADDDFSFFQRH